MGKICVNGIIREATPEEEAELEKWEAQLPTPAPTLEDRLAALEAAGLERDVLIAEMALRLQNR